MESVEVESWRDQAHNAVSEPAVGVFENSAVVFLVNLDRQGDALVEAVIGVEGVIDGLKERAFGQGDVLVDIGADAAQCGQSLCLDGAGVVLRELRHL